MLKINKTVMLLVLMLFVVGFAVGCGNGGTSPTEGSKDPAGTPNTGQEKITLKVGHVLAPDHPYQAGLEHFAKIVNERSNGRISIDVFHSSQLGGEREAIEALQMGTNDMTIVSTAPLAGFSNSFLVLDLPFIFQDKQSAYKVLDGPIGQGMLDSLDKVGIVGLGYWENGFRHVTNSGNPVLLPSDMNGKKIRTMENKIHMDSFRTIGADPTPMAFGELFTALQQKTVDAQENPVPIIFTSNFFEVQKYLSLTGHFYAAAPLLVSKTVWGKLSTEDQKIISEAAIEARDFERGLIKDMDDNYVDTLREKGMQVDEVDKEIWIKAMEPVYKKYEAEIGADLIQQVLDAQK